MRWFAGIVALALALCGCGGGDSGIRVTHLPSACVGDEGALVEALAAAPGRVVVDGRPISRCFVRNEDGGELQALGTGLLAAAQRLGDRARAGSAKAAVELGYLIGAAERGARRTGVAGEMIRRLEAETGVPASLRGHYTRGLRAGLAQG